MARAPSGPPPGSLSQADCALLNAMAALHLRYDDAETARDLLELSHWYKSDNPQTLRLLATAHLKLEDVESAAAALRALKALPVSREDEGRLALLSSLVARARGQTSEARRLFSAPRAVGW